MQTRTCTVCLVAYPATLEFFYKDKRTSHGLRASCKWCRDGRPKPEDVKQAKKNEADYYVGGVLCNAFSAVDRGTYTEHKSASGGRVIEFDKRRPGPRETRKFPVMQDYKSPLVAI